MTDPVQPRRSPVVEAARDVLDLRGEQLHGPTANELQRIHAQDTLVSGVVGLSDSTKLEFVGQLGEAAGGITGGAVAALSSVGGTLWSLVQGYASSVHEGDQLNEAYRRDAVNQATLWLSARALPPDFVRDRNLEYAASGSVPGQGQSPSNRIINSLIASGEFSAARRLAEHQANAGRSFAERVHLTSDAALEFRLANDRAFRALYHDEHSAAFRLGVQSVIFEAQHPARQTAPGVS